MGDSEPRTSWWSTLPGILTGVAATVTAIGGLVIAVGNAGWFSKGKSAAAESPPVTLSSATTANSPAAAIPGAAAASSAAGSASVVLPEQRDYHFGTDVFTLLAASLEPRTTESKTLVIHVRMLNNNTRTVNFIDSEFRLLIDGVPRSPESNLNELVDSRSAKDGDVKFEVPAATRAATLRIYYGEGQSDIPLQFGS